ncbi:hypothetical protein [Symmachiella dynata]|uniref:hypothetical protein n=1 Tax=Symmachiella dynata TaxID=2527995 RepID=UPI0030EE09DB|tara:strand:+ start:503 stop:1432 length:930 start_codon:yes stop_codon:yes gene_type:complete
MTGTYQWVKWALQRPCLFKTGPQWFSPKNTASQLLDLQLINSGESEGKLFDGIYVMCFKRKVDANGVEFEIPELGHRLSASLIKDGLWKQAQHVCGQCEANVAKQEMDEIVGCHGTLQIYPEWSGLDDVLRRIIEDKGLEARIRARFVETMPRWYGLWAMTPLSKEQCEILQILFGAWCDSGGPVDNGIPEFLRALRVAIEKDIALQVSLAPPGHFDFGYRSVFSHCPRCKAGALYNPNRDDPGDDPRRCSVCGFEYSPKETGTTWELDHSLNLLINLLGQESYKEFARSYLMHYGVTSQKADELMEDE